MHIHEIYTVHSAYREDMKIKGYTFGQGEKSACIVGALRGNEIQQMYVCSQLIQALKELENNSCICTGKQIQVIPGVNSYSINVGRCFFGVDNADLNRGFPGNSYGEQDRRIVHALMEDIGSYDYGIQFASFYMDGEFMPHVRMMETGYQNTSLANLFGLPYVVVHKPAPIATSAGS